MRSQVLWLAAAIALAGCGNGEAPSRILGAPAVGLLVDAPVAGVEFETATQSGFTTAEGEFLYRAGETVRFSLGGIDMGETTAGPFLTPVEVTGSPDPGTVDAPNAATRLLRFLQSVDADRNPSNGITIDTNTRSLAEGVGLDFATASDSEVDAVIGIVSDNPVIGSQAALDFFYEAYKSLGGSTTFDWPFPGYPPFPGAPVNLLTNGGFEAPSAINGDVPCSTGWQCFNQSFTNNTGSPASGPVSHEPGEQSVKQFGVDGGIFQTVAALPGATYTASVWAMNWTGDPLKNLGIVQLTFWSGPDGTGNVLGTAEAFVDSVEEAPNIYLPVQDGAGASDWTQVTLTRVAPAGTVSAKLLLLHVVINQDDPAGTIRWDDATLTGPAASSGGGNQSLVWQEEFNTGSSPDPDVWTIETGYGPGGSGWGNDEWQLYTDSTANVGIVYEDASDPANGYLRISALLDTAQCPSPGPPPGCGKRDGSITSARMISLPGVSRAGKSFRYGRITASIKFPGGRGSWPAFWMLGEKFPVTGWPKAGEVDIAEMFNGGGASNEEAVFALHWCDESLQSGQCSPFPTGYRTISAKRNITITRPELPPPTEGFRIYEAEWTSSGVVWRVDGVTYYSYPIAPATMEEFLEEFFLLLNVAIGGNPVPAPDAAAWPRTMLVDWIRLYQ